jgi:SPP1 gp7 family putative phage head morphogenesis protein
MTQKNKNNVIKGNRLNYNASIQSKYEKEIKALISMMTKETNKKILSLFESPTAEEFFSTDASISSQAKLVTNELLKKYGSLFKLKGASLADKTIKSIDGLSSTNLKSSLKSLTNGLTLKTDFLTGDLKEMLKASVNENVSLIESIAENYLSRVQKMVMRSITTGNGLETIIPSLKKYDGMSDHQARTIANDQTRKIYNTFNKARMEKIGVKKFEWIHSAGGLQPRQSHIAMSGKIFSFDDLPIINKEQVDKGYEAPEKGIPGQAINCRCTMTPVMDFEEE